jgi:hypothetical protein
MNLKDDRMDALPRRRWVGLVSCFCLLMTGSLLGGCSSGPVTLTLRPANAKVAYEQKFNQAYCGRSHDGSYTCVLVADDAPAVNEPKPGKTGKGPLTPTAQQPLRQVVHVRVLWRPLSGTRDSVVSNATIDWYVLSNTADGGDDLLLYQGSGYVMLSPDDKTTTVDIKSAEMRPALIRGALTDPIGDATITGKFEAVNNNEQTAALVSATRQRTAAIASGR